MHFKWILVAISLLLALLIQHTKAEDLKPRMIFLEAKLTELGEKLDKQEHEQNQQLQHLQQIIEHKSNQLEQTNQQLQQAQAVIENQSKELIKTKQQLKEQEARTKSQINRLRARFTHRMKQQDDKLQRHQNKLESLDTFVSFTAWASQTRNYSSGDQVMFDSALRNYGSAYNPETSSFECPITGYYMFMVTVRSNDGNYMHGQLYILDEPLVNTYGSVESGSGSNMAVILCEAGQTVYVVCSAAESNTIHGTDAKFSVFTGTLLSVYETIM